jgi:hypothetical protein
MTIHIELGWWLLPLAVSVGAFGYAAWADRDNEPGGDYSFPGIVTAIYNGLALIVSLIAWLIWAAAS